LSLLAKTQKTRELQKKAKYQAALTEERVKALLNIIKKLIETLANSLYSHNCLYLTLECITVNFDVQDLKLRIKELEEENKGLQKQNKDLQTWFSAVLIGDH
jgi:cell division protein FtsL